MEHYVTVYQSADGMGEGVREDEYDAWIAYLDDYLTTRLDGVEITINAAPWGLARESRFDSYGVDEDLVKHFIDAAWDDWCSTGWNAYAARQGAPAQ